jgi:DNA-binding winged helix-turn-helix (wHTH) protein/TolB-like protein
MALTSRYALPEATCLLNPPAPGTTSMDARSQTDVFLFGPFRLDRSSGLSRCDGTDRPLPVNIGSRALDVLSVLVERHGELVSKDEIMSAVWPNAVVTEANLTVQISTLRRVLDQACSGESAIQTVPGRGYRFVLRVTRAKAPQPDWPFTPATEPVALPVWAPRPRRTLWRSLVAGSCAVAVAVLLIAAAWHGGWWPLQGTAPRASTATHQLQAPDWRMSTIIFPFENSSGDAAQDGLAVEITRHVTELIARSREGPVVAGTATVSQASVPDLHAIRREHHVHFVLTGNAQRQDGHLIVAAALYDTAEARVVWGRQINVPDGPGAPTTIGQVIYENWWQTSVDAEDQHAAHDHPDSLDEHDLLYMSLATPLATPTKANYQQRLSLVDHALALDPNYLLGLERRARWHAELVLLGYSSNPATDLAIATEAADHALAIDPNSLNSLRVKATVLRARGDWTTTEALLRRVLTLQPTEANRHSELGDCLMAEGRHQEALASFQTAKQFAGGSDGVYWYDANIAGAYLALGQLANAVATAQLALGTMPPDTGRGGELPWLVLIAATSLSGNEEAARAELQKFLATPRSWHSMTEVQKWSAFAANPNLLQGLRRVGMPD